MKSHFKIPYSIKFIGKMVTLLVVSIFIAFYTAPFFNTYILHSIIIVGVFVALSFALGLIRLKEIAQLLKKE